MRQLKVMLTVPQYQIHGKTKTAWLNAAGKFASTNEADLVVFPEGFLARYYGSGTVEDGQALIRKIATKLGTAVLAGFKTDEGYETALYFNPKPERGETADHIHYKHVVSDRVAFKLPDWEKQVARMLRPISIKGVELGAVICYEMFVPLIVDVMEKNGADVFIDLTGDNVQPEKWKTIVGGRSLEAKTPFLCTMGYYATWPGKAISLAYDRGKPISMLRPDGSSSADSAEPPTFSLATLPSENLGPYLERGYSPSWERDITVSLGTGKAADIEVQRAHGGFRITSRGKTSGQKYGKWLYFDTKNYRVALLNLSIKDLSNRRILLENLPAEPALDKSTQHVVLYSGGNRGGFSDWEIAALASLRVLEHSVAVLVMAGAAREVFRQTKMRKIMRLQERDGLYGIKVKGMNNLKGPSFPKECSSHKEQYLSLLKM